MGRLFHAAAAVVALATAWAVADAGCSSDLTATSPGHDLCSGAGLCLAGFECDVTTNTCVPSGSIEAGPDATAMEAGPDATPMEAGPDATPMEAGPDATMMEAGPDASETDAGCGEATPDECAGLDGGSVCVDTKTDPQFCGGCASRCTGGETCADGGCAPACAPGLMSCNGACANLESDPGNCGKCGTTCLLATLDGYCQSGACKSACASGYTACAGTLNDACVNLQTDPTHCGVCGTACTANEVCLAGACKAYVPASGCWECSSESCCATIAGQTVCACP